MRTIIYPYKMGSQSAKLLARGLDGIRVYPVGRYTPRSEDFIINWGSSTIPGWYESCRRLYGLGLRLLNKAENVRMAANKLHTFQTLQNAGVAVPDFTTNITRASEWMRLYTVYARQKLTGHSGEGIVVVDERNEFVPDAPLYVKGIDNHGEYRVNVMGGRVIDYIKKRRHRDDEPTPEQSAVRNLDNGWVYTRQNLKRLERVEQIAIDVG